MGKRYMSFRWPNLSVGTDAQIKFKDGYYTAKDEEEEKIIEGLSYFGPLVWEEPVDGASPTERDVTEFMPPPVDSEKKGKKWRAQ